MDWINVKTRLPEEHELVDTLDDQDCRSIEIEFYNDNFYSAEQAFDTADDGYGCFQNTYLMNGITHWMPLPKPPAPELDVIQSIIEQKVND